MLDVGHNPPALTRLFERAHRTFPNTNTKFRLVLGLSYDKDLPTCLATVLSHVPPQRLYFVKALHPRAATPQQLQDAAQALGVQVPDANCHHESVKEGVEKALEAAKGEKDEVVLVCGTFFIMGEARQALGLQEPQDSDVIAQVAGSHFRASQELFTDAKAPPAAP